MLVQGLAFMQLSRSMEELLSLHPGPSCFLLMPYYLRQLRTRWVQMYWFCCSQGNGNRNIISNACRNQLEFECFHIELKTHTYTNSWMLRCSDPVFVCLALWWQATAPAFLHFPERLLCLVRKKGTFFCAWIDTHTHTYTSNA